MKISKIMNKIRLDLMILLKVCNRDKINQLKIRMISICRKYYKSKYGIGLAVCIMLIPAALSLLPGAELQKIMQPSKKELQVAALKEPQEVSPSDAPQPALDVRTYAPSVSRGANVDRETINLLAQVIEGEAADEPYQGKVAVGAVIINRTESAAFPKTIPGVIYDLDAFESVSNGQFQRPLSQDSLNAAVDALNGSDPTGGALYFWNPATASSPWVWSRPIVTRIGRHVFAR
jgi:N-acetylmuramoyl-L-alanine amidase